MALRFAVSLCELGREGVDHIGVSAPCEMAQIEERLAEAGFAGLAQDKAACCYAAGDKFWHASPSGTPFELYGTTTPIEVFGPDRRPTLLVPASEPACCPTPAVSAAKGRCC